MTRKFEVIEATLMGKMPVTRAGKILVKSATQIQRMLTSHVNQAHARLDFSNAESLPAYSMNRSKGHN